MRGRLDDDAIEALMTNGGLVLDDVPGWQVYGASFRLIGYVSNDGAFDLQLVATWNPRTDRYAFALVYPPANQPIRRYCSGGRHRNPGERRASIVGPHKHGWTARTEDRVAYVPTDITAPTVSGRLRQFMAECGVACAVAIPEPPAGPARPPRS